jgi:uncharacterized Zn-finger protein
MLSHGNSMSFECPTCGKKFQNKSNLVTHQKGVHLKKDSHQCPSCPSKFSWKSALTKHMRKHTDTIQKFNCIECEAKFSSSNHLRKHYVSVHMTLNLQCKICKFEIKTYRKFQTNYIKHVTEAHNDLPQDQLDFFIYEIRKLKYSDICPDLPAFLKEKSYTTTCQICSIKFKDLAQLQAHKESAHQNRSSTSNSGQVSAGNPVSFTEM